MAFERVMGLDVHDKEEYQCYRKAMMPILAVYGGHFGYDFEVSKVLQSKTKNNINRVFTIEFPTENSMILFFEDPEYLAIKKRHFDTSVTSKTVISTHYKN